MVAPGLARFGLVLVLFAPLGPVTTRSNGLPTITCSLPQGFEFEGEVYKSLSAVAKAITGQHCNGYYFFRLGKEQSK